MQIYPAIDVKNGQCVRLRQGRFDDMTVYGDDPLKVAGQWMRAGANFIHVVDLDGARLGASFNGEIIRQIVAQLGIAVQTGGGIRSMRDIEEKLALGARRVVLGTAAVNNPDLIRDAVQVYGDRIAVGIDANGGRVAIQGWEVVSQVSALELCQEMAQIGVKTIIYTDISKDGMMIGPNVEAIREVVEATPGVNIIASGGISSLMDLEQVEAAGAHGAIIGKALYQGALQLNEVLAHFNRSGR